MDVFGPKTFRFSSFVSFAKFQIFYFENIRYTIDNIRNIYGTKRVTNFAKHKNLEYSAFRRALPYTSHNYFIPCFVFLPFSMIPWASSLSYGQWSLEAKRISPNLLSFFLPLYRCEWKILLQHDKEKIQLK